MPTINSRSPLERYLLTAVCTEIGQHPPQQQSSAAEGGVPTPPAPELCCWGGVGHGFRCAGGVTEVRAVCGRSSCRRVHTLYAREIPCALCPALSARRCALPPRFCKILQRWGRVCPRPSPSLGCPCSIYLLWTEWKNDKRENDESGTRTRGGMKVAARIGEGLRREIGRGRRPSEGWARRLEVEHHSPGLRLHTPVS